MEFLLGTSQYTVEIVFYHDGTGKSGLIGMGTYNNSEKVITNEEYVKTLCRRGSWSSEKRSPRSMYEDGFKENTRNGILEIKNAEMDVSLKNFDIGDGKANALRTSDDGNGIKSYYWGNDVETGNIGLGVGIHTVTALYDGSNTKIYVDGEHKKTEAKAPNTVVREITVGATNLKITAEYKDNISPDGYPITDSNNWDGHNYTLGNSIKNYFPYRCYKGEYNCVELTHKYEEFLNSEVYSVRIYNRALTDSEITYNYITDYYRFVTGT